MRANRSASTYPVVVLIYEAVTVPEAWMLDVMLMKSRRALDMALTREVYLAMRSVSYVAVALVAR